MRLFVLILAFVPLGICHPKLSRIFWCLEQIADILNPADYDTITLFIQKDEKKKEGYMFAHVPSPIAVALRGDLNETLCDMSTMSSYLKDCLNDNDKTAKLNPVINRTATLCKLAKEMEENDKKKMIECIEKDKNGLEDKCPGYKCDIKPKMEQKMATSCCKEMTKRECITDRFRGQCDNASIGNLIANSTIAFHMFAYTVMELNYDETEEAKRGSSLTQYAEHFPRGCAELASGAVGKNLRSSTWAWTLLYFALISGIVQVAIRMSSKFDH